MKPIEGRSRVIIEEVAPQIDGGRYAAKRVIGDVVNVTAAVFGDGHDHVAGRLLYRRESEKQWRSTPLTPLNNDMWTASFTTDSLGKWVFSIEAWVDHFDTWASDLRKRLAAQPDPAHPDSAAPSQNIPLALRTGALLLEEASARAEGEDASTLR